MKYRSFFDNLYICSVLLNNLGFVVVLFKDIADRPIVGIADILSWHIIYIVLI